MPRTSAEYHEYEIAGVRFEDGPAGLVAVRIDTPIAFARMFTQGAHLTEWTPAGEEPVLFVSARSEFLPGKAIRGGIPVCFPWFAARQGSPGSPAHGVVRTAEWELTSSRHEADEGISLQFSIRDDEATRVHWDHSFVARYCVKIGAELTAQLEIENTGQSPFKFEAALHTYFRVGDIQAVTITGLENTEFLDKVDSGSRKREGCEPLRFSGETDRVFVNTRETCTLHDPALGRRISVAKAGSATTVIWNPWVKKAAAMADFGDSEWVGMLCIETANTGENAVDLAAGQRHTMAATISVGRAE